MVQSDFFFFSSRRRHTRCSRDWSSDVCSSDLWSCDLLVPTEHPNNLDTSSCSCPSTSCKTKTARYPEIGRASCRERVKISVAAVSLKKKKKNKEPLRCTKTTTFRQTTHTISKL